MQDKDWHGCEFGPGTRICGACSPTYGYLDKRYRCTESTHTVFEIKMVMHDHGGKGNHYYHAEAPGYGAIHVYEDRVRLTDKPVSDFFASHKKHA